MYYPSSDQVQQLAKDYSIVPVSFEAYADTETPISIFKCLCRSDSCFLLESVEGGEKWGRYSFIGRNPFMIVKGSGKRTELFYRGGNREIL